MTLSLTLLRFTATFAQNYISPPNNSLLNVVLAAPGEALLISKWDFFLNDEKKKRKTGQEFCHAYGFSSKIITVHPIPDRLILLLYPTTNKQKGWLLFKKGSLDSRETVSQRIFASGL